MIKLLKYLRKRDIFAIILIVGLIVGNVWLELEIFEYMQKITTIIASGANNINEILKNGGLMIGCAVGSMIGAIIVNFFVSRLAARFGARLRDEIFKKVSNFSSAEIKHFSTASLITRTTNDVTQVQNIISMGIRMLVRAPVMAIMALCKIVATRKEWTYATITSVIFIFIMLGIIVAIALPRFKKIQKLTDDLNRVTREGLTGTRVVRAFNAEDYQENKFNTVNDTITKNNLFINKVMSLLDPTLNFVMSALPLAIYVIGAYLIYNAGILEKVELFSYMTTFSGYAIQVRSEEHTSELQSQR